jgi:ribosomal-protein-alanine N-acetyltransferase
MKPSLKIRLAQESDLPQLTVLSQASGEAAHWTQQQWLDIFHSQSPPRLAWIAETGTAQVEATEAGAGNPARAVGFLVAQNGGPEWELENIAVLPEYRRQGVARELLSALLAQARALLAERILLEVRAFNQAAIRFYEASGFQPLSRRRDYYRNPPEDALIFVHPFPH